MPLNKGENGVLWETEDFIMTIDDESITGYQIINRRTGQMEAEMGQEFAAVLQMQALQDEHSEVMEDPERAYIRRKTARRTASQGKAPVSLIDK